MRADLQLASLLTQARDAVTTGDLPRLEDLATRTERTLANLQDEIAKGALDLDATDFARLKTQAQHNAALLASALAGVQDAQRRLTGKQDFNTYDSAGRRSSVAENSFPPPRRA